MSENLNLCLSGGAKGADTEWGNAALNAGHDLVHWVFNGFNLNKIKNYSVLDAEKLSVADQYLDIANKTLKRQWPTRNEFVNNLLRRNYYQINWSDKIYAIGQFINDNSLLKIKGGTAWACQMYVDKWLYSNKDINMNSCRLYFFDQLSEKWYKWGKTWEEIDIPPKPIGVYAGIGTRDLSSAGISAIKNAYL